MSDGSPDDADEDVAARAKLATDRTVIDPLLTRPSPAGDGASRDSHSSPLVHALSTYSFDGAASPYAEGSMGTILVARDETLGRDVAIKALRPEHLADEELRLRLRREAAITARLQHPGVPPVFCIGAIDDARPFFSMQLVVGETLARVLKSSSDRAADRPRLLTIFGQLCQTIAYAHARGVVHRDLKPENVLIGDFGTVYVLDWGVARVLDGKRVPHEGGSPVGDLPLASEMTVAAGGRRGARADAGRHADSSLTLAGELLGTLQYMAPEQARGDPDQDERADVFSLGAILFEILTGEPLRPAALVSPAEIDAFAIEYLKTMSVRLGAAKADCPIANLAAVCLEPDRSRRPKDARDVAAEMTSYLLHVLRRPEREMARFFELSPDLFCLATLDGYFTRINDNFSRVLGHKSEEILSRPFLDYVHPEDLERTREQMAKLVEGKPVVRFENRYRDHRGEYLWFEWNAKTVPDEDLVFAVARDITGRKNLERRLMAIVETSPMGVAIVDMDGRVVQVNREFERIFGYRRDELLGRMVEGLIPARFRDEHPARRAEFLGSRESRPGRGREVLGLTKDGAEIPLELGLSPFETEEGTFVTAVISEIGDRRRRYAWLETLVRTHPEAVLLVDEAGLIAMANDRAEPLLGLPASELSGRRLEEFLPGFRVDSPATTRVMSRGVDGTGFPIEARPLAVTGGGAVVTVRRVGEASEPAAGAGHGARSS
ncbi:PAS domain S-box protein [Aquisphaera insulae]|uniref:PAS domain S-box protein n=1 Tax=Aquisphaera insulae TaxID=2712864 RepID=UPI0013EA35CA|nr:PAS domain S-box protein [Aquisphaera insulae]